MESREAAGVLAGYLMPHPPVLVPAVGGGREREAARTDAACREAARRIASARPDAVIVISPHAPLYSDSVFLYPARVSSGSFARFGAGDTVLSHPCDTLLRDALAGVLSAYGLPVRPDDDSPSPRAAADAGAGECFDHGVLVPLWYVAEALPSVPVVALAPWATDGGRARLLGSAIAEAARRAERRVCVIASGDMSHRVNPESPYGMVREGAVFDSSVRAALRAGDLDALFSIDPGLSALAGECGLRSLMALAGLYPRARSEVLSYEAPFGIGYCVAEILPAR